MCNPLSCRSQSTPVAHELEDSNQEEINVLFRPCAIDSGRTDAYTADYVDGQSRLLGIYEYYAMTGSIARSRELVARKQAKNLQELKSIIPTPKTTNVQAYNAYVTYMLINLRTFSEFHSHNSAISHWKAYCGRQQSIEEAANIIINGGKKYNPRKRRKKSRNKRWRKRTRANRAANQQRNRVRRKERRQNRICCRHASRQAAAAGSRVDVPPAVLANDVSRAGDVPDVDVSGAVRRA